MSDFLFPFSAWPDSNGRVFPGPHIGATNSKAEEGMQVEASLGADSIWHLRFRTPTTLPSGTAKLVIWALANATSGAAKINPKWANVDPATGGNPDTTARTAEGTTTLTWGAGDNDDYKQVKITLDAVTVTADRIIAMDLTFETTAWTLAVVSTWFAAIVWE